MSLEISDSPSLVPSAFPSYKRPAEDTIYSGQDFKFGANTSIPDYIRAVYKSDKIFNLSGEIFPFLDRDNTDKHYDPAVEDPFVFRNQTSINLFKSEAKRLIAILNQSWVSLGGKLKFDDDRKINLADTEAYSHQILANPDASLDQVRHNRFAYLGSNLDIMKKACLVRTVLPGWWVVSYRGKNAPDLNHFSPALRILTDVFKQIRSSSAFKAELNKVIADQGDPLDTNVGYPLFSANVDKNGTPLARNLLLGMFKDIGKAGKNWKAMIDEVSGRVKHPVLSKTPFAVSCIRRQQPGYKWSHHFKRTSSGLKLVDDYRGFTTNRVAFNASYLHNLLLSPVQSELKTIRKLIPGLFHDGDFKKRTLDFLRAKNPLVLESDFSNYDRNIPVDLSTFIFAIYSNLTGSSDYYFSLLKSTNSDLYLIWPEQIPGVRGSGYAFHVDKLALLSGLKITSEVGTFVNLVIVMQSILDSKEMNSAALTSYLLTGVRDYKNSSGKWNNLDPLFLIQSDDTLIIKTSSFNGIKVANEFAANSKRAGIKGSLEIGDRFLMRHMTKGQDSPIWARIWQNTLSNEEGADDSLKFLVGLAMRTDGVFGFRLVDPFGTGAYRTYSKDEQRFGSEVCQSILLFLTSAAKPQQEAIVFVRLLLESANKSVEVDDLTVKAQATHVELVNSKRKLYVNMLAKRELQNKLASGDFNYETWILALLKDKLSPSTATLLEALSSMSPEIASIIERQSTKENAYYVNAMKTIGISMRVQ